MTPKAFRDPATPFVPPTRARWLGIACFALTAIYIAGAIALLMFGALKRFQLPQSPLIDPDIEGYLGPAISALAGRAFLHLGGRSFPYPLFVYLILRLFGDFKAIAVIQHILGLIAGALILLAWNAVGALIPSGGLPKPLFRLIGLAPAYIFLGSATAISFEHQIRPEGIFAFLAILDLWLSFLFIRARFVAAHSASPVAALCIGAANVFVAFLIYMAKPSFGLDVVISTLPVWFSLILPGADLRRKVLLAVLSLLPALLLLFLPEHLLKKTDRFGPLFLPETLLTIHAPIVLDQMSADLASNTPLPYPRDTVQSAHDLLATEYAKARQIITPKAYGSLGFNPDYLMYEDSFCTQFQKQMHWTEPEMAKFCMTWYLRALKAQPGAILKKVRGQMALFYKPRNPAYWLGKNMDLSTQQYQRVGLTISLTAALGPGYPPVARYVENCNQLAAQDIVIPQARRFVQWLIWFADNYLHLLIVALISPIVLIFPPLRKHLLWLVIAQWLTYGYNFGNCLTIAFVHSLEVTRYVRVQLIFTIFAETITLAFLAELAVFGLRVVMGKYISHKSTGPASSNSIPN